MARIEPALVILQRLQQGPASKGELIKAVLKVIPDAYDPVNDQARDSSFECDLKTLRYRLEADIACDRATNLYSLRDPGPFSRLAFSDDALASLAFLFSSFDIEGAIGDLARPFLQAVQSVLTAEQAQRLEHHSSLLHLKLQNLDQTIIAPIVWKRVNYAVSNRHVLRFKYRSTRPEEPSPLTHIVEPYDPARFHGGHFELRAYCRHCADSDGRTNTYTGWTRYRLDRILSDSIEVLPETLRLSQRKKPLFSLRYLVSPTLVRGGISRHFEDMRIEGPDENGWAVVTGKTTDLFEAERIFLAYGQHCIVLEPPELVKKMTETAVQLAEFYKNLANS